MGEFVSNVARLLDESQMRKFNEGVIQGIQKGKIEGKIEVAKKMIRRGFSDEDIAELTELDIEKVKELRKELIN
jgi:predicted transposase/invertase (TIGR01784 family)